MGFWDLGFREFIVLVIVSAYFFRTAPSKVLVGAGMVVLGLGGAAGAVLFWYLHGIAAGAPTGRGRAPDACDQPHL